MPPISTSHISKYKLHFSSFAKIQITTTATIVAPAATSHRG